MKFTTLKIENFLAITSAELKLDDRGLCLIQGENLDDTSAESNGAGKSSLADALCWCLYGETARGVSGDHVINEKAGKGTLVQVDIEDGDDIYRIARHRKHPKGKNGLTVMHLDPSGSINDLTKGTDKLTQEVVEKIVGASRDVFRSAVYAGQEQMPDLPAMTDKNLKVLIEEASGVTLLEEAYRQAREKLSFAKQECDTIRNGVEKYEAQRDWINDQIVTTTASRDAWKLDIQNRISAGKAEIKTRIEKVREIDADIAKADEPALRAGVDECDTKLAALGSERDRSRELHDAATKAQASLDGARDHALDMKREYDRIKGELDGIQHKVGCPCDECGREITENEIAAAKAAAQKRLDQAVSNVREAKKQFEAAQKRAQAATSERDAFDATMTDPSAISAKRASLQAKIDAVSELKRERSVQAAKAKNLGDEVKRLAAEPNPHEATLVDLRKKLDDTQKVLDDLAAKLKDAEAKQEVAESVVRVFAPSGVRAHILDEVTPYLNQQTAKYLETLSDGNIEAVWSTLVKNGKGELREKFTIEVANDKGAKNFAGLSGGEKRKVRVSAALALQDLVATRATKPIDLFIGDEIDDALDPAGLERLTMILEDKAHERGSVFIISHNDLKDWVSQSITVRKKDGETTLVEETS